MSNLQIAKRYSKSLLESAISQKVDEQVYSEMKDFLSLLQAAPELRNTLKSPVIKHLKKAAILKAVFTDKLHPITLKMFELVCLKGRESFLPEMAKAYIHQYEELNKIGEARLITSYPIDEKQVNELRDRLKKSTGKTFDIVQKEDPSLIGGFILRLDDQQYDASVRSHLNSLRNSLVK